MHRLQGTTTVDTDRQVNDCLRRCYERLLCYYLADTAHSVKPFSICSAPACKDHLCGLSVKMDWRLLIQQWLLYSAERGVWTDNLLAPFTLSMTSPSLISSLTWKPSLLTLISSASILCARWGTIIDIGKEGRMCFFYHLIVHSESQLCYLVWKKLF